MTEIVYEIGDATKPPTKRGAYSVICHCCNTLGSWGAGFVLPLGRRFPAAKQNYLRFIGSTKPNERLGKVSYEKVDPNIVVANIMGQERIYRTADGKIPLDYNALKNGFEDVLKRFLGYKVPFTIHMPRIGCGLAGGEWSKVSKIIEDVFCSNDIEVFVYDLL